MCIYDSSSMEALLHHLQCKSKSRPYPDDMLFPNAALCVQWGKQSCDLWEILWRWNSEIQLWCTYCQLRIFHTYFSSTCLRAINSSYFILGVAVEYDSHLNFFCLRFILCIFCNALPAMLTSTGLGLRLYCCMRSKWTKRALASAVLLSEYTKTLRL